MEDEKIEFTVMSSWHDSSDGIGFPHIFIIEFPETNQQNITRLVYNQIDRQFKTNKNKMVKYLTNYGDQDIDWSIGKHRGKDYNLGAALILRFKEKDNAIAFMLQNS